MSQKVKDTAGWANSSSFEDILFLGSSYPRNETVLILVHCPHEEKWQGLEATRNWLTMGSKSVVSRSTVEAYMRQYMHWAIIGSDII